MGAFIIILLSLLGVLTLIGAIWIWVHNTSAGVAALREPERRELMALRKLQDKLTMKAYERLETDPFAIEILDDIRATQRSISKQ